MQLIIKHLNSERETCTLILDIKCNLDKAKRLADDLYYVCTDVNKVSVLGDTDTFLYQTN